MIYVLEKMPYKTKISLYVPLYKGRSIDALKLSEDSSQNTLHITILFFCCGVYVYGLRKLFISCSLYS
jgi:hypothetical protein